MPHLKLYSYLGRCILCALLSLPLLLIPGISYSQVYGCTDPIANNYNPSATINNGGCSYNAVAYTPLLKIDPLSDTLVENSGLQMAGNYLWAFNDGGGAAAIYRIDTISKVILQTVKLAGASNIDWEDIAYDGLNFYIGDFGNNANGARTDLTIYKFPFSAIPDQVTTPVATIPAQLIKTIHFTYSDQPQPPVPTLTSNATKFDCEAMIVDNGRIHLFTKNWININTTHYEIPDTVAGTYVALPLETLTTNYLVTAADKAPGREVIALLGYQTSGNVNHFIHLLSGYSSGLYFNGNKRQLDLPNVSVMGQAEGIAFRNGVYGYINNERFITVTQKLKSFNISGLVSDLAVIYRFTGNGNWDVVSNWDNNKMPPATIAAGSEIVIDPVAGGKCVLNIPYRIFSGCKLTVITGKGFEVKDNLTIQR